MDTITIRHSLCTNNLPHVDPLMLWEIGGVNILVGDGTKRSYFLAHFLLEDLNVPDFEALIVIYLQLAFWLLN
jgi:hypothetical protein